MSSYVHVLQNPIKVISIRGNLNDKNSWSKPFSKQNGNIFNGIWLIGMKSFSYYLKEVGLRRVLNVGCNVITGFEQNFSQSETRCKPYIAQVHLSTSTGTQNTTVSVPSFFVINNVCDVLELDFTYFPVGNEPPFNVPIRDIKF